MICTKLQSWAGGRTVLASGIAMFGFVACSTSAPDGDERTLVIRDVTVIDGTASEARHHQLVEIHDGSIAETAFVDATGGRSTIFDSLS